MRLRAALPIVLLVALTACSEQTITDNPDSEPGAATQSAEVGDSLLATTAPSPTPTPPKPPPKPKYPYKGYPKVVALGEVPSNMQWTLDHSKAVAVAPGVWTEKIPGVSVMRSVLHGAYIGYCAAVTKAQRKLGNDNGSTCW